MSAFDSPAYIADLIVVTLSSIEVFILEPLHVFSTEVNCIVLRVLKILRIFRLVKLSEFVDSSTDEIRILVRTLQRSFRGVLWTILLLSGILVVAGILMVQLC